MAVQQTVEEIPFSDYYAAAAYAPLRGLGTSNVTKETAEVAPEKERAIATEMARVAALVSTYDSTASYTSQLFRQPDPTPNPNPAPYRVQGIIGRDPFPAMETIRLRAGLVADTVPFGVEAHWEGFRRSGLPPRVFNALLSASISPKRLLGRFSPLSGRSVSIFLALWAAVKDFSAEPVVSVSPKGWVIAEWVKDNDNSLAVMFSSDNALVYSLFEGGVVREASVPSNDIAGFVQFMLACQENPFSWSDA